MLEKEFQTVLVWNESTAITKDVFLTLMEINQTDLAYVRHQFLFIAHLSTKWKKPCLPWTDFHLGLCSVQFECLRVLINARLHGWLLYVFNNESSSSAVRYLHTIRQSQWKACHTISTKWNISHAHFCWANRYTRVQRLPIVKS